jgi:hypothetical protein
LAFAQTERNYYQKEKDKKYPDDAIPRSPGVDANRNMGSSIGAGGAPTYSAPVARGHVGEPKNIRVRRYDEKPAQD